jgi:hypothetical protein
MRGNSGTGPTFIEAFALGRPTRCHDKEFRDRIFDAIGEKSTIDILMVGSDRPANVVSIRKFIHEVFSRYLGHNGVKLVLVGRSYAAS